MTHAISITGLEKTYDNGFVALKGVDLAVEEGDFFGLLGPNGAGKSTLIGSLCSLVVKSAGSIKIFDIDVDEDFSLAKKQIGVVPQEFNFSQFEKVEDIVITQAGFYGIPRKLATERTEKYLKLLGLWDKRHTVSRTLSGGMKRRLMIARAMVHEPRLLILDEPTAGVDIELRRSMWEFLEQINKQGTTIILTTHYLEEAESLCRNIGIIDEGELIHNTSKRELLTQLNQEVFVFDLSEPAPDDLHLEEYKIVGRYENSIEVELNKGESLNGVFAQLNKNKLEVLSMRNKVNRLEELFVRLLEANDEEGG